MRVDLQEEAMPRELIEPKSDKRYVRRKKAKKTVKKGEGDRGDQKRRAKKR